MTQLALFSWPGEIPITEMPDALTLLREGASLVLSVSGGKDSDAMCYHMLDRRQCEGWSGEVVLIHADLGRAEWHSTPAYVQSLAERLGLPLHIVRWTNGDLIDRIWQRWDSLNHAACPWPSSAARYCTSDLKRGPISRWIRQTFSMGKVICAMGLRAQESSTRAKKSILTPRTDCTAPTKNRFVYDWLPIHDWTEDDVWACIRSHGNTFHEAYRHGNRRLSCACCVLASVSDLLNGALHNPDTYCELCRIEAVTGYSFRPDLWLSDLKPDLLPATTLNAVRIHQSTPRLPSVKSKE